MQEHLEHVAGHDDEIEARLEREAPGIAVDPAHAPGAGPAARDLHHAGGRIGAGDAMPTLRQRDREPACPAAHVEDGLRRIAGECEVVRVEGLGRVGRVIARGKARIGVDGAGHGALSSPGPHHTLFRHPGL
jgi:hypothetical protein